MGKTPNHDNKTDLIEQQTEENDNFLLHVYQNFTDVRFRRKKAAINGQPIKMSAGIAFPFIQGDSYVSKANENL
jgi:hypothetical protein